MRGWKYVCFDGSTDRARRNYLIRRFNEPDSPYFLFLITTRSGGMGLNLQTADTCILFDSDWNPQSDIQAMARVHRIGQTKTVHVYRLMSAGTVEERVSIYLCQYMRILVQLEIPYLFCMYLSFIDA